MTKPTITDKQYLRVVDELNDLKRLLRDRTLIGTCGECQWWIGDLAQSNYGDCRKRLPEEWRVDDGCRKWEKKND